MIELVDVNFLPKWFFTPFFHLFGHATTPAGAIAFALCLAAGLALSSLLQNNFTRRLLSRLGLDRKFIAIVTAGFSLGALLLFVVIGLNLAGLPIQWETKIPAIGLTLSQIIRLVAFIVLVFWFASVIKRFLFNRFLSQSGLDRSLQYAVAQVAGYVMIVTGLFLVVQNTGIDLSPLTIFAGAVGVGVGFGLQNIASNFISGLVILGERPIKIGDRVVVDGLAGRVRQIRARSTTIVTNDNIAMIVPNSKFIENTVTNWSHGELKVRFRIPVGVAYGTDTDKLCAILIAIAKEHPAALATPEPTVFFDSFGDSSLNFELAVWSEEMSCRPRQFRSDLNFAINRKLAEAGIVIPFPQRDVHLHGPGAENGKVADSRQ